MFAEREGWDYRPEPERILFGEYVQKWFKEIWCSYRSESRKRDFQQIVNDRLLTYFGDKTFYQITSVELQRFIATLRHRTGQNAGKPLSRSRVGNILIPFRTIWNDACEENHWDLPDPFRFTKKHIPKGKRVQPEVFRFDEWRLIIDNMNPYYRIVAEIMVMTGMIGSEIAGLRKKDIQDGHIVIQNSIVRKHEKSELKTDYRKRKLPITAALKERLEIALSGAKGDYVLTMRSGRIFDVDSFRKNPWATAFKMAEIPYRVPYTTRHSFAAWALTLGMNPNKLVRRIGHGSKKMVYEVYGNYVEGLERDAGKILQYFGNDFINL